MSHFASDVRLCIRLDFGEGHMQKKAARIVSLDR